MVFEFDIIVPANTLDATPYTFDVLLCHGVIHQYEIYFPPGCANMVKVAINRALHQIWPTNPDGFHKGEGTTLSYREHQPLDSEPYILTIKASSPGTTYEHKITVRFAILPRRILTPWLLSWAEKLGFTAGQE